MLEEVKKLGGSVGFILICQGRAPPLCEYAIAFEDVPTDIFGLSETLLLKQTLNLISNSEMILMNKVHGNCMIDVLPSNNKLIDRCMRLIKTTWSDYHSFLDLSDQDLSSLRDSFKCDETYV